MIKEVINIFGSLLGNLLGSGVKKPTEEHVEDAENCAGSITQAMLQSVKDYVTVDQIKLVFPNTPIKHIEDNLPLVLCALEKQDICDKDMVTYALATIAVENPSFAPVSEKPSKYSTKSGLPPYDFSKYDTMTGLGNTPALDGDGALYKGRGLLQITGHANYVDMDKKLGLDGGLLENPDNANEPHIAAAIFAQYFKDREVRIRKALGTRDLVTLRKIVNGGTIGFDVFEKAYTKLEKIIN